MEKKVVWLSRADACALLAAKDLYRHLMDWLPAERAAESLFSLLALGKFRAQVRQRCFVGGTAESDHILVPVDPEVYLVLKALGLCGQKDSRGREICVRGREWKQVRYIPYTDTLRTMINVFRLISGEKDLLTKDAQVEAEATKLFGTAVMHEVWGLASYLNNPREGGLRGMLQWAPIAAFREGGTTIGRLNDLLYSWINRRIQLKQGKFEEKAFRNRRTWSDYVTKLLLQSAVDVCFHSFLNSLWTSPNETDRVNSIKYLMNIDKTLQSEKKVDTGRLQVAYHAPDKKSLSLQDFLSYFESDGKRNRKPLDDANEITLGLAPSEVLAQLSSKNLAERSLFPVVRFGQIDPSSLENLSGENADTSYLCQTLLHQYAVLFTDYAKETLGELEKKTFSLRELQGEGPEPKKIRKAIKVQFVQAFFSFHKASGDLLGAIKSFNEGDRTLIIADPEANLNAVRTLHDKLTALVEDTFRLPPDSSSTLSAFLKSKLPAKEKEKTKGVVAKRLLESILLSQMFILQKNISEHEASSVRKHIVDALAYVDQKMQGLMLGFSLPVFWRKEGDYWKLERTLDQLRQSYSSSGLDPGPLGVGEDYLVPGDTPLQNALSAAVREASGLGSRGKRAHPVFAPEPILEAFRSITSCPYNRESQFNHTFSPAYIELLKTYFVKDLAFLNRPDFFMPLEENLKVVVRKLRTYLQTFRTNYSNSDPDLTERFEERIKLELKDGYHINLDPPAEGLFIVQPFLRWMFCMNKVPNDTKQVVAYFQVKDAPSSKPVMVPHSLAESPLRRKRVSSLSRL
jgi:hypothetical protein